MRKSALILVFLFIFLSTMYFALSSSSAQDLTATKAYQDYQYQTSNYMNAEAEYEDAKTFYKKNPTLQLREEARIKTLSFLKNRDQLMVVYLTALRTQIAELTGFTNDDKSTIYSNIDPEVTWYQAHINSYQDGDELNTLFNKSDDSKNRYQTFTKFVVYNALFDIGLSEEIGLRVDHQNIYADIKKYIDDQVVVGKLQIDPFNRWINDTDSILQTLGNNETQSKSKVSTFYAKNYSLTSTYNKNIQILTSSVGPLNQLNNYLTEMINYIQTQ